MFDEEREQDVFATAMRPWLARTAVRSQLVTSITGLASGYFATLMHCRAADRADHRRGGHRRSCWPGQADRWEPVGIDCVANNVNDVICTGAVPLALLDYIATDRIDAAVLEAIARGLYRGADEAGIAIPGGEIAQIGAMLADSEGGGPMLDLVGTAVGAIPDGRSPVDGSMVRPGDVVPGPAQFGPAQQRLFAGPPGPRRRTPRAGRRAARADPGVRAGRRGAVGGRGHPARAGAHLRRRRPAQPGPAGRGRVVHPGRAAARAEIASSIAAAGDVPAATMYATFNMGTGFCVVVSPADAQAALDTLTAAGEQPVVAGSVTSAPAATCQSRRPDCWAAAMCSKRRTIPSRHGRPWLCRGEC